VDTDHVKVVILQGQIVLFT